MYKKENSFVYKSLIQNIDYISNVLKKDTYNSTFFNELILFIESYESTFLKLKKGSFNRQQLIEIKEIIHICRRAFWNRYNGSFQNMDISENSIDIRGSIQNLISVWQNIFKLSLNFIISANPKFQKYKDYNILLYIEEEILPHTKLINKTAVVKFPIIDMYCNLNLSLYLALHELLDAFIKEISPIEDFIKLLNDHYKNQNNLNKLKNDIINIIQPAFPTSDSSKINDEYILQFTKNKNNIKLLYDIYVDKTLLEINCEENIIKTQMLHIFHLVLYRGIGTIKISENDIDSYMIDNFLRINSVFNLSYQIPDFIKNDVLYSQILKNNDLIARNIKTITEYIINKYNIDFIASNIILNRHLGILKKIIPVDSSKILIEKNIIKQYTIALKSRGIEQFIKLYLFFLQI